MQQKFECKYKKTGRSNVVLRSERIVPLNGVSLIFLTHQKLWQKQNLQTSNVIWPNKPKLS